MRWLNFVWCLFPLYLVLVAPWVGLRVGVGLLGQRLLREDK